MTNYVTAEVAAYILDALGCGQDPIYDRGKEYQVGDFCNETPFFDHNGCSPPATRLRIEFFAKRSWVKGTLADMVLERMGERHRAVRTGNPEQKKRGRS